MVGNVIGLCSNWHWTKLRDVRAEMGLIHSNMDYSMMPLQMSKDYLETAALYSQ